MKTTCTALALSLVMLSTADLVADEPESAAATLRHFFERLDANKDGKVTCAEAPEEGKMLVEFLLSRAGKKKADSLGRQEFMQLTSTLNFPSDHRHVDNKAVEAALANGEVQQAPENCPACAMGLTAEFVFNRLDVNQDKLVTVKEFRRSPGMDDEAKAQEAVGRLDKTGDGALSWRELKTAYEARHANCKKPNPATLGRNADRPRPDGRGDGIRFAQVFILRSDQNGDGKVDKSEFRGGAAGFQRLDKNKSGFIEVEELGELHRRRLNDPKTMKERLRDGDANRPPQDKRPKGLGESGKKAECTARIGGRTPQRILAMLGAQGRAGVGDEQLATYRRIFGFADANGDGQHSKKEFIDDGRYLTRQARQGIFRASDSNSDGVVSEEEYIENRIITDEAKAVFDATDTNDNGKLALKELVATEKLEDETLAKAVFEALDSDGNGELVMPEYLRVWGRWARSAGKPRAAVAK